MATTKNMGREQKTLKKTKRNKNKKTNKNK